jgi:tryptophanyl-tRNA synthetase
MTTRVLTGITTSGTPHLGNYVGAVRPAITASRAGDTESFFFLADLHSLIKAQEPDRTQRSTLEIAATWLAAGLEPDKVWFYRQSDIPEISELTWFLTCVASKGILNRAHAYKAAVDKNRAEGEDDDAAVTGGLFMYPVLMAADILLFNAHKVPVGRDQVQHIEFTRDWAVKFNLTYVPGYDPQDPDGKEKGHAPGILKLPAPRVQESTAVVPGVDGQKMSKSYGNTIELFGEEKEIKKRIMGIKTDSTPVEAPKPTDNAPLYDLLKLMLPADRFAEADATWRAGGKGYGDYKKLLLAAFLDGFAPARQRYEELRNDPAELERLLQDGAGRARAEASQLMQRVRRAVGVP